MTPQMKKIKEEFKEKFFVKNGEMSVETYMAVWDFFSQSLSDYKKELVEKLKKEIIEMPFGGDKHTEMILWSKVMSLLQKDKENKDD